MILLDVTLLCHCALLEETKIVHFLCSVSQHYSKLPIVPKGRLDFSIVWFLSCTVMLCTTTFGNYRGLGKHSCNKQLPYFNSCISPLVQKCPNHWRSNLLGNEHPNHLRSINIPDISLQYLWFRISFLAA